MHSENGNSYKFQSFRLDLAERRLFDGKRPVPLTPKAFAVLAFLVEHDGHLVEKDELMRAVWPDSFVEEANLSRIVHTIRKALREDDNGHKFIETVPTRGYCFVAEVIAVNPHLPVSSPFGSFDKEASIPATGYKGLHTVDLSGRQVEALEPGIKTRTLPNYGLIAALIFLIAALSAGFYLFSGYWPTRALVGNLAPETFSGEALQDYQQGKFFIERRHDGDYQRALELFEKAIAIDPNYANAYAGKADVKVVQFWGSSKHEDIIPARTAVRKAIELDPKNSYAHAVLCRILTTVDWDHKEAEKECRIAVEYGPNDQEAQKELAFLLHSFGRDEEALAAMNKAIAIAPTSFNKRSRGMILYQTGRYDEAIEQLKQVEETDPIYKETSRWLVRAYEMKKDYARALETYLGLIARAGAKDEEIAATKAAFEKDGWPAVLKHMAAGENMKNLFKAGAFAQLGEKDKAFETLEEMFKRRAVLLVTLAREPTLDPIRDDPRFEALLNRVGLK